MVMITLTNELPKPKPTTDLYLTNYTHNYQIFYGAQALIICVFKQQIRIFTEISYDQIKNYA